MARRGSRGTGGPTHPEERPRIVSGEMRIRQRPRTARRGDPGGWSAAWLSASFIGLLSITPTRATFADAKVTDSPGAGTPDRSRPAADGELPPLLLDAVPPEPAAAMAASPPPPSTSDLPAGTPITPLAGGLVMPEVLLRLAADDPQGRFAAASPPPAAAAPAGSGDRTPPPPAEPPMAATVVVASAPAAANDGGADADPGVPVGTSARADEAGAVLAGTDTPDRLAGAAGDDILAGMAGDDELAGGGGEDVLLGGAGDDRLRGGAGADVLRGDGGRDTLAGGGGDDRLAGGAGGDLLAGGGGDDLLEGGPGRDQLEGGGGDDLLAVDQVRDVPLDRGATADGDDTLVIRPGFGESVRALHPETDGAATLVLDERVARPLPEDVHPYVRRFGPGIENLRLEDDAPHDLVGSAAANRLEGNEAANRLYGLEGDDVLLGGGGDDLLAGGPGDDWLDGGAGSDLLQGGAGDDVYLLGLAEDGPDWIEDPSGRETLRVNGVDPASVELVPEGADLRVEVGDATIARIREGAADPARFRVEAGETASLTAEAGDDASPPDVPDNAAGPVDLLAPFLDLPRVEGTAGADILYGRGEGSWIAGGAGHDLLVGTAGDDLLAGGPGNDELRGGPGDDTYLLRAGEAGVDLVADTDGKVTVLAPDTPSDLLDAFFVGDDLWLRVDGEPAMAIQGVGSGAADFAGVRTADGFVEGARLAGGHG